MWMFDETSFLLEGHFGYSDDHGLHREADDRHHEYDRQLREFKLHWIEEPTNPDDVLAHQAIAQVHIFYDDDDGDDDADDGEEPTNPDDVLAHQAIAQVDDFQKLQFLVSLSLFLGSRP